MWRIIIPVVLWVGKKAHDAYSDSSSSSSSSSADYARQRREQRMRQAQEESAQILNAGLASWQIRISGEEQARLVALCGEKKGQAALRALASRSEKLDGLHPGIDARRASLKQVQDLRAQLARF